MSPTSSVIVGSIGLALTIPVAIPAAQAFYKKLVYKKEEDYDPDDLYEDDDGVATEKSQKEFSTLVARAICLGASLSGFLLSLATATVDTADPVHGLKDESWFAFGEWVRTGLSCQTQACWLVNVT